MYTPRAFIKSDLHALDALAASDRFITLVTVADDTPQVSHLAELYRRMQADRILLKFKLTQSHPLANRSSVIERLEALGDMSERDVAALMRARLTTPVAEDT